jgi:hypothetical protein
LIHKTSLSGNLHNAVKDGDTRRLPLKSLEVAPRRRSLRMQSRRCEFEARAFLVTKNKF